MSLDPRLRKLLCYGLIGCGALAVMSGVTGIISSWQLIGEAEEQSLGITRNEFLRTYAVFVIVGAGMVFAGLKWKK